MFQKEKSSVELYRYRLNDFQLVDIFNNSPLEKSINFSEETDRFNHTAVSKYHMNKIPI